MSFTELLWDQARSVLGARVGLDFSESQRPILEDGLRRGFEVSAARSMDEYVAGLANLPEQSLEWIRLLSGATVRETYFFRDAPCFQAIERHVLAPLIEARRRSGYLHLAVWSAGCATGEEPYSLAILLDRMLPDRADWTLSIVATDINREALDLARVATYRGWALRDTPPAIRDRYFRQRGRDTYVLDPEVRNTVHFVAQNITAGLPGIAGAEADSIDLILCRNVLMYLTPAARRQAVGRLARSLRREDGWLVPGATDGTDLLDALGPVELPGVVFFRRARPGQSLRALRLAADGAEAQPSPMALEDPVPMLAEPVSVGPSLASARALAGCGDLDSALRICEDVLGENCCDLDGYLLLATVAEAQDNAETALTALRRAIYLDADCAIAHFLLGGLLLRRGKPGQARRSLDTALRLFSALPADSIVAGADGLTAGALLGQTREYLALAGNGTRRG